MKTINYDGKVFRMLSNEGPGDVDPETVFFYHQKDDYLWGHYEGGEVVMGVILGRVQSDFSIDFDYQHFDKKGVLKEGHCISHPQVIDARILLHEKWEWKKGSAGSGTSILEEIKDK
jgi:hypothetical protein